MERVYSGHVRLEPKLENQNSDCRKDGCRKGVNGFLRARAGWTVRMFPEGSDIHSGAPGRGAGVDLQGS